VASPEKLPQPLQSQGAQRFIEFGEHLAGMITESMHKTKTKTGDRLIWLDAETIRILKLVEGAAS